MGKTDPCPTHPSSGYRRALRRHPTSPTGNILPTGASVKPQFHPRKLSECLHLGISVDFIFHNISYFSKKPLYFEKHPFPNIGKTPLYENTYFWDICKKHRIRRFWRFWRFCEKGKNAKNAKMSKSGKIQKMGFHRFCGGERKYRFFGFWEKWHFQEKGVFFEKGILRYFGRGSKIGVSGEGVKKAHFWGIFLKP